MKKRMHLVPSDDKGLHEIHMGCTYQPIVRDGIVVVHNPIRKVVGEMSVFWEERSVTRRPISWFLLLLSFLFCSCAETRIYESGRLACVIQGDATNVTFSTGQGTYFHADTLNHSVATQAAYAGASGVIGEVAAGVVSGAALIK